MNLMYSIPAYLLSSLYAKLLEKKFNRVSAGLDKGRFSHLLKAVRAQMFSPMTNRFENLTKNLIAAYFISPGDLVIDVGAHIGRYAAYYSYLVGNKGEVFAYEAHPLIFNKLKKNLEKFPQALPCNFAVSNQSNCEIKMKIYPDELDRECATVEEQLMNSERMPGNTAIISVACQKLDDLAQKPLGSRCSFIKIDVEGHEHAVINGALGLIQKHRPVVVYEYGCQPGVFEPRTIEQMNKLEYVSYNCRTLGLVGDQFPCPESTDLIAIHKTQVVEFELLASILKSKFSL